MSKEAFKQIVSDAPDIQQAVTQHAMNDMANVQQAAQPAQDGKSLFGQILSEAAKDIGAELGRLGAYGAGQNAPEPEKAQEQQQQMEQGGMGR